MRARRLLLLAALVLTGLAALPATAATPSGGVIDGGRRQVNWSGGPLTFSTLGTGCEVPQVPQCDTFTLTVGAMPGDAPDILVSGAASGSGDVLMLYVYGPDGSLVAREENLTANPRASIFRPKPGVYSVRFEALLSLTGPTVSYKAIAAAAKLGQPPDAELPCNGEDAGLGPPPAEVLEAAADDDGRNVNLDVLVYLDGVSEGYARSFFQKVAAAYAPLRITVIPTFKAVPKGAITSNETTVIISQTQDLLPKRRVPAHYDVVELLTNRDVEALGTKAVAGQAKCIGGAHSKEHSFNVSEAQEGQSQGGVRFGPLTLVPDVAAKITAHEIGHLYGGQHHFANCVEGADAEKIVTSQDSSPCSLMFNSADFMALHFGTLNGRIVRGYALLYSTANDPKKS